MFGELEGDVTAIVIAHRLSTVRKVDLLVYLHEGRVISTGTFTQVVADVPEFARQAALMGLEN
jgi:ABC-type multidrug transport system fused ATPase/permease subunit